MDKHSIQKWARDCIAIKAKEAWRILMGLEDTMFECEICTHVLPKEHMSPTQNVCDDCAGRADHAKDYE